ncbi:MAG: bifunctional acetate--CoA ligase family protein/GNAT family N-acetyltransferase [Lewinellaceae bacterium]|nr:bifunctional acetate--CoA ligase family protein/GNAT family N-acetyltransferase [Lewinellaceae bacterium]
MKHILDKLFQPKSIALVGASDREHTVGYALMQNLIKPNYKGVVYPVNIKHRTIAGHNAYKRVDTIPHPIDLVIIATPAVTVPEVLEDCGKKQVLAVVIISAGFKEIGAEGKKLLLRIEQIRQRFGIRIIGPNCFGFINTSIGLNATFGTQDPLPGNIAFISQSGALGATILDWSEQQQFGFNHFVSVGSMIDIGFHDLIDYFGTRDNIRCILIYMETLENPKAFMSAARAYSRSKPIIVLKSGTSPEGASAALSHTGSLAGDDAVFAAAFARVGILRVETVAQLFYLAKALAMQPIPENNRLAVVTNAGGPAIMATDYLIRHGGHMAPLPKKIIGHLNQILPSSWSRKNPVDVLGDASALQYRQALEACLEQTQVDGVLAILCPQAITDALDVAKVVTELNEKYQKPLFAAWMGLTDVTEAIQHLEAHQVPNYTFPEDAVDVFLRMAEYARHIRLLYETPPDVPADFTPQRKSIKSIMDHAIAEGHTTLSETEAKQVLSGYDIPSAPGMLIHDEQGLALAMEQIPRPWVMKIASPDILHKTEVSGVRLNIKTKKEAQHQYHDLLQSVQKLRPEARIEGVRLESMVSKRYELLVGAKKDSLFGPVIVFGSGGIAVEILRDTQIALPPLNMALAQNLIEETRIYQILKGFRNLPPVDLEALKFLLCRFAYLLMDFPQIRQIDLNPLAIDETGQVVLDARIILDPKAPVFPPYQHLVITPYPVHLTKKINLKDLKVTLRPIRPEDEPLERELFEYLSRETIYFRFFGFMGNVSHEQLSRFTHIDYDREMAIVAEIKVKGRNQLIGVVRLVGDPWGIQAEYAIVVADPWQGRGLGSLLTDYIIEYALNKGYQRIFCYILKRNDGMIHILEKRGFIFTSQDQDTFYAAIELNQHPPG